MNAIFLRNGKYLNFYYKWVDLPDLFPDWQVPAVLKVMTHAGNPTPPTGWAWVKPGEIVDLDALEVVRF